MTGFFALIFVIALIALPISLIRPGIFSRFFNATRTKNALFLSAIIFVSFVMVGLTAPKPTADQSTADETQKTAAPTQSIQVSEVPTVVPLTKAPTPTPTPTATPTKKPTTIPTKTIYPTPTTAPATSVPENIQTSSGGFSCNCSKTCPQISSCEEAQYLLNSCGCGARDGDDDGIACDGAPLHCQN